MSAGMAGLGLAAARGAVPAKVAAAATADDEEPETQMLISATSQAPPDRESVPTGVRYPQEPC
jgi:hypothetical protein